MWFMDICSLFAVGLNDMENFGLKLKNKGILPIFRSLLKWKIVGYNADLCELP